MGKLITPKIVNNNAGNINIKADQLKNLRQGYRDLHNAAKLYIVAAVVGVGLTIFVANRRLNALRNLSIGVAAVMGLIVGSLSALGRAKFTNMDSQEQGATQAAINGVLASLKHLSSIVGLVSLLLALVIIFTPIVQRKLHARKHAGAKS